MVANADTILSNEKNDLDNMLIKYVNGLFLTNYFYVEEIRTALAFIIRDYYKLYRSLRLKGFWKDLAA